MERCLAVGRGMRTKETRDRIDGRLSSSVSLCQWCEQVESGTVDKSWLDARCC